MRGTFHNLHSNMVRFIMNNIIMGHIRDLEIYIPIWLDLLYGENNTKRAHYHNLHSNMVRFIMKKK